MSMPRLDEDKGGVANQVDGDAPFLMSADCP